MNMKTYVLDVKYYVRARSLEQAQEKMEKKVREKTSDYRRGKFEYAGAVKE